MRKKTEELWKQALAEQTVDSDVPETFRRLVIENERECAETVGVTASLPGTNNGYTFVAFNGSDVPVGTKLFTFPPASIDRNAVIEEMAKEFDSCSDGVQMRPAYVAIVLRALKSQPAAPDPRDEALRIARAALDELSKLGNGKLVGNSVGNVLAYEALAAIDKVIGEK